MAIFEPIPVDIHLQVQELDHQSMLNHVNLNGEIEEEGLDKFAKLSNVSRTRNADDHPRCSCVDEFPANCISSNVKNSPSRFGHLWRKFGVGNSDAAVCACCVNNGGKLLGLGPGHRIGPHEMAVRGMHIDERILPGFRYHVRILSNQRNGRYQFNNRALRLLRIGNGYGRRLTFESELANINPNFFWSDTHPDGYAFSICAVEAGDEFVLCRPNHRPVGYAMVEAAGMRQIEVSSTCEGKSLVKKVIVSMQVSVRYTSERHGMMSLRPDDLVDVMGLAVIVKPAGESKAVTKCIEEVDIPGFGECHLYKKDD